MKLLLWRGLMIAAGAGERSQYHEPTVTGASVEKGWSAELEWKLLWEAQLGPGDSVLSEAGAECSSPVRPVRRNNVETVTVSRSPRARNSGGTPASVNGRVYAYGSGAVLTCLEAGSGKVVGSYDLVAQIRAAPTAMGMGRPRSRRRRIGFWIA